MSPVGGEKAQGAGREGEKDRRQPMRGKMCFWRNHGRAPDVEEGGGEEGEGGVGKYNVELPPQNKACGH